MAFAYANDYQSVLATAVTNGDLEVVNGFIEDGSGNRVTIGKTESTQFSYRGVETLGVDRVAGATPTGDLTAVNGTPHVNGYGDVTLTDPSRKRAIDSVGGANGNDGRITTDSNGAVQLSYDETETYFDWGTYDSRNNVTGAQQLSATLPSSYTGDTFVELQAEVRATDQSGLSNTTAKISWDFPWDSGSSTDNSGDDAHFSTGGTTSQLGNSVYGATNVKDSDGNDVKHDANLKCGVRSESTVTKTTSISVF